MVVFQPPMSTLQTFVTFLQILHKLRFISFTISLIISVIRYLNSYFLLFLKLISKLYVLLLSGIGSRCACVSVEENSLSVLLRQSCFNFQHQARFTFKPASDWLQHQMSDVPDITGGGPVGNTRAAVVLQQQRLHVYTRV